jgi:hypothetical protein
LFHFVGLKPPQAWNDIASIVNATEKEIFERTCVQIEKWWTDCGFRKY